VVVLIPDKLAAEVRRRRGGGGTGRKIDSFRELG